jgi:hypothetical protein
MSKEIVFENIALFIETLKKEQLQRLIFAETNEKRSIQISRDEVQVLHVKKAEILAYKRSTIYKCIVHDESCDNAEKELLGAGFEINKRDRNII